ncbi:hypothetical protein HanPI659440_Chr11g0427811 [Helianthus annuus]|nr:hypothetical protein HanPI659440_Chr11g0427811 [Helianthus annuus]
MHQRFKKFIGRFTTRFMLVLMMHLWWSELCLSKVPVHTVKRVQVSQLWQSSQKKILVENGSLSQLRLTCKLWLSFFKLFYDN